MAKTLSYKIPMDLDAIISFGKKGGATHIRTFTTYLSINNNVVTFLKDTVWIFTTEDYAIRSGDFVYLLPIDEISKLPIKYIRECPSGFDIVASPMQLSIVYRDNLAYGRIILYD